jgi:hypothetical protein
MTGESVATPAATALAALLSRRTVADAPPPAPIAVPAAAVHAVRRTPRLSEHSPTDHWRRSSTGPPSIWPSIWGRQLCYA